MIIKLDGLSEEGAREEVRVTLPLMGDSEVGTFVIGMCYKFGL